MKSRDPLYEKLVRRMEEVSVVPPQQLGPFTSFYKIIASQLKVNPWKSAGVAAVIATLLLYWLMGGAFIRITSILQYGF